MSGSKHFSIHAQRRACLAFRWCHGPRFNPAPVIDNLPRLTKYLPTPLGPRASPNIISTKNSKESSSSSFLTLRAGDRQGSVLRCPVTALFSISHQGMLSLSWLCLKLDMTCSCSESLKQPAAALCLFSGQKGCSLTTTLPRLRKNCQGSYFQTINCTPLLTHCLVGLVMEFFLLLFSCFFGLLVGTQALMLLYKSAWRLCAPEEAVSTVTPLCWL